METVRQVLEQSPLLALFAAIGLGYALGQISVARFSLGVGAVLFAGLAPGFAGLYQINVRLPRDISSGALDLVVSVKDIKSKPAKLDVR